MKPMKNGGGWAAIRFDRRPRLEDASGTVLFDVA